LLFLFKGMAKYKLRLEVKELWKVGTSVKAIASTLGVVKSSVSWWGRDIILNPEQIEKLRQSELSGRERGRLKCIAIARAKSLQRIKKSRVINVNHIPSINTKELFFDWPSFVLV